MSKILLDIDNDMLQQTVKAEIAKKIAEALGGADNVAEKMISLILGTKVDSTGKISRYSSDNKFDWLEVTVKNKIQEFAKDCISEMLEKNKQKIKQSLEKKLQQSHSKMAKALMKAMEESLRLEWRHEIKVSAGE